MYFTDSIYCDKNYPFYVSTVTLILYCDNSPVLNDIPGIVTALEMPISCNYDNFNTFSDSWCSRAQ